MSGVFIYTTIGHIKILDDKFTATFCSYQSLYM